jgi:hypothetical protein
LGDVHKQGRSKAGVSNGHLEEPVLTWLGSGRAIAVRIGIKFNTLILLEIRNQEYFKHFHTFTVTKATFI